VPPKPRQPIVPQNRVVQLGTSKKEEGEKKTVKEIDARSLKE
jgi:hypothetical protein